MNANTSKIVPFFCPSRVVEKLWSLVKSSFSQILCLFNSFSRISFFAIFANTSCEEYFFLFLERSYILSNYSERKKKLQIFFFFQYFKRSFFILGLLPLDCQAKSFDLKNPFSYHSFNRWRFFLKRRYFERQTGICITDIFLHLRPAPLNNEFLMFPWTLEVLKQSIRRVG